jgi:uncharacterized protein (DUF1330 family)
MTRDKAPTRRVFGLLLMAVLPALTLADDPPGYILVSGWYKDLDVQRAYNQAVGPVLRRYGYEAVVAGSPGTNLRVLEGGWAPRPTLLIKFTSEDHAKRFWWSDDYHDVKAIRSDVSALDIVQLDGVTGVTPRLDGSSAYLLFFGQVTDHARLAAEYAPFAAEAVRAHGGQFLVRAGRADIELLEGTLGNVWVAVLEFPGPDVLQTFWNSSRYQQLSEVRRASGKWSVVEILPVDRN